MRPRISVCGFVRHPWLNLFVMHSFKMHSSLWRIGNRVKPDMELSVNLKSFPSKKNHLSYLQKKMPWTHLCSEWNLFGSILPPKTE